MPLYTFKCDRHGEFDLELRMMDERPKACPNCGRPIKRVFHAQNIVYRAGGFRVTDKRLEPTEDDLYD
jgi:putative FmdB family regulatory protein